MFWPWIAWAIIALSPVQNTAACTETSTNCASPVASRRWCATSAASALSTAAWCQVCGTVMRTGRRSGSPLQRHHAAHRGEREVGREVVGVRPVLPERADRDVHEIGPRLAQRREAEPARVHRAGAGVLDHEVGARDQREEVRAAARAVEVEHDAALAAVEGVEAQARERVRQARARAAPRGARRDPPGGSTLITSAPSPASTIGPSPARASVRSRTRYGERQAGAVGIAPRSSHSRVAEGNFPRCGVREVSEPRAPMATLAPGVRVARGRRGRDEMRAEPRGSRSCSHSPLRHRRRRTADPSLDLRAFHDPRRRRHHASMTPPLAPIPITEGFRIRLQTFAAPGGAGWIGARHARPSRAERARDRAGQ